MSHYRYKAIDADGRHCSGRMEALNIADLEARLKRNGLDLILANSAARPFSTFLQGWRFPASRAPRRERIDFCFHLEQLLRAGVPIREALTDLRDSTGHSGFRDVIGNLIEALEAGQTLSQALQRHQAIFDPVFVHLVHAGEISGRLPEVLENLGAALKWEDEISAQAKRGLLYPVFSAVLVLGASTFLLIYLVPQLQVFLKNMGQTLPMSARVLFFISDALRQYWPFLLGLPLFILFCVAAALRFDAGARRTFDRMSLRVPLFGAIRKKIVFSRFAAVFALLYASGIPVLEAVRVTQNTVGSLTVRGALEEVETMIADGHGIAAAFQRVGLFPPLVIRMLKVGENTGALDDALNNVRYFYNRDVRDAVEKMQTMAGPALIVVLGLILGWIMLSVIGPIYDAIAGVRF
ncbi:MAG: type II secretion system F family protein [Betaproteobacteria bacterium]|nr:type II secretion system F family protein [Betaproteobacteria bacterium]